MQEKVKAKTKYSLSDKRAVALVFAVAIIVGTLVSIFFILQPERSVASYCKVYKEENSKLPHDGGDKYRVAIFTSSANDPGKFAAAFNKLERVSPEDIQPDVKTLKAVFEKIENDPSQSFGVSLSGIGAEQNVKKWTGDHCISH